MNWLRNNPIVPIVAAIALSVGWFGGNLLSSSAQEKESPASALELLKGSISSKDWQTGHDALLAALRSDPGDQAVFEKGCEFVRNASANEGEGDGFILAEDALGRLSLCLAYLPVSELRNSRKKLTELEGVLYGSKDDGKSQPPAPEADPFAAFKKMLAAAKNKQTPVEVRLSIAQDLVGELDQLSRQRAFDENTIKWEDITAQKKELEVVQNELLEEMYNALDSSDAWKQWVHECDNYLKPMMDGTYSKPWEDSDKESARLIDAGSGLLCRFQPYADGNVANAKEKTKKIKVAIRNLGIATNWRYSKFALNHLDLTKNNGDLPAHDKLRAISTLNHDRLVPFVQKIYTEHWELWMKDCPEDVKLEVSQRRLYGGR